MVLPSTVPVLESKLQELERDHTFLAEVQERNDAIDELQAEWEAAFELQKQAKKKLDAATAGLREFIKAGPAPQSATPRLPFAGDLGDPAPAAAAPVGETAPAAEAGGEAPAAETRPAAAEKVKIHIPPEIAALEITTPQKESLVRAGCQTVADVVNLGNKNVAEYPNGFDSLQNFGPKAIAKLKLLLPSTAPPADAVEEGRTVRVRLLTYSGQDENLKPGSEFDATEMSNGNVLVQLPGGEPVEFLPHEFEKLEPVAV